MDKYPGTKSRVESSCASCKAAIHIADSIWPRFEQTGWICVRCADFEQPEPIDRILARLDYLDRMSRTCSLRRDELEVISELLATSGVVGHARGNAEAWVGEGKRWILIDKPEDILGMVQDALHFDFNPHLGVRSIHFLSYAILTASGRLGAIGPDRELPEQSPVGTGMTGAEARLACETIGLPRPVWASHLAVPLDEIKVWEFRDSHLPQHAVAALETWRERFLELVAELVHLLDNTAENGPIITIHATDRSYWAAGGTPPVPASMHRAAVASVMNDYPSLRVVWG